MKGQKLRKWRTGAMLALMAGMLISQLYAAPVWAEEGQTIVDTGEMDIMIPEGETAEAEPTEAVESESVKETTDAEFSEESEQQNIEETLETEEVEAEETESIEEQETEENNDASDDMPEESGVPAHGSVSSGDVEAPDSSEESTEPIEEGEDAVDVMIEETYGNAMSYASTESIPSKYSNILLDANQTYGVCRTSFLTELAEGGYQTAIYHDGKLYITNFDKSYQVTASKVIALELPIWGGLFFGRSYNYVVCGKKYDSSLEDGGTVYKIIKYDKNFNELNSVSISGTQAYTYSPFDAGNVSIDESDGVLTVYTSRGRLDGHQSNIVLRINTKDMTISDTDGMAAFPNVHVSHSFRQIFRYDNGKPVYVDLSDAYPKRSVYIQYDNVGKSIMDIAGQDGHNETNADVSGLEISDTHYLVTGTYMYQDVTNVFLSCVDKKTGVVTQQWLTDSSLFVPCSVIGAPKITRITGNKYVIMWGRPELDKTYIEYVVVDSKGTICGGEKRKTDLNMTDCTPIFNGKKIIWLSVENGKISFEEIDSFETDGVFELKNGIVKATNPWDGTTDISWYKAGMDTFEISTPQQLAGLAELVNNGNTFEGKTVYLVNDIFLNDGSYYAYQWIPISSWQGTFHGNGHTIYNMWVSADTEGGLFSTIAENGIVKAVNISQGILDSGGCIAHINKGIIAFCNNYSCVGMMGDDVGGICNGNYNWVYGCKNYGEVWGQFSGGIVGKNLSAMAVVSQCSNWGLVEGTSGGAAGIAFYNSGWIYNCYNRGVVANGFPGNINTADKISGIVHTNSGKNYVEDWCVENSYSVGFYSIYGYGLWTGPHAITTEGKSVNCYAAPNAKEAGKATILSSEEMKEADFLNRLDQQNHTVLSAWMADTDNINSGLPITVADYNYAHGIYKMQPELWTTTDQNLSLDIRDGEYELSYACYYNEKSPVITVGNSSVAQIEDKGDSIVIKPLKKGNTYINIHFEETENILSADYRINVKVTAPASEGVSVAPPAFTVKGIIGGRNVTFRSSTEGATIYYSTTSSGLTVNDKSVANGNTVTFENYYGTVYARAYKDGVWSNVARLVLKIPVVNTPTITESEGKVTIRTTTPDCAIYYTMDGSIPSPDNGKKINASAGSFYYTGGTVKAIAVRSCFTNSGQATAKISSHLSSSIGVPSFQVKGVVGGRTVTFRSTTPGSRIYYSESSSMTSYDKWVSDGGSVTFENFYGTIYARTYSNGQWSNVSRLILKIPVVNKPTITAAGYGRVKISTSTPDCTIYYTTDGSMPSPTHGTRIGSSSSIVTVANYKTVRAIAVRSCFTNSDVETSYMRGFQ